MGGTPTGGGGKDEGVAKFEALIAKLKTTIDQMQDHTETVEGHASALDDLEDTVDTKLGDVEEELRDALQELETARDEAVAEIDEVATAARAAADERLQAAAQSIDAAEGRFGQAVAAAAGSLDEDGGELRDEGFGVLAGDLDVVEAGLTEDKTETEGAVDTFEAGVLGEGQEFQQALADTAARVEEATTATVTEQTEIVAKSDASTGTFESEGPEFGQQCTTVYDAVEAKYGEVAEAVSADAQTFVDMVRDEFKAMADAVDTEIAAQIEEPVDTLLEEDAALYSAELDVVATLIAAVEATGTKLDPVVTNLETCQEVCDVIKEVLKALE